MEIDVDVLIKKIPAINVFNRAKNIALLSQFYIITGGDEYLRNIFIEYVISSIFCKDQEKPCRKCLECQKIMNGTNVDVVYFGNDKENIKKEQVQKIIETVITKPFEYNEKIVVVNNFENVSENNQNLLLKILEELPTYVIVLFVSDSMLKILPTIQSRARIITLTNFTNEDLREIFRNENCLKQIECSNGKINNIYKFLANKNFTKYYDFATRLCEAKHIDLLEIIAFFEEYKNDIELILEIIQNIAESKISAGLNQSYLIKLSKTTTKQINLLNTNINKNIIIDQIPVMIYRSENANIRDTI